jgi:hypothetical protein
MVGMVSHVSHSVHVPPKEHIYTKGGPGWLRTVRIVGDGLTCLTFGACTIQTHTKGGPG